MQIDQQNFWVFGYGSLMWRPGFAFEERRPAVLRGAHRRLCLLSHIHRGTPDVPGLVLGLDRGGSCRGIAFRVAEKSVAATIAYLHEREQTTYAYREVLRVVQLDDGRAVSALMYIVDRTHRQYTGPLGQDETLRMVRQAVGQSGPNAEYIRNTVSELRMLDIQDATLTWLAERL